MVSFVQNLLPGPVAQAGLVQVSPAALFVHALRDPSPCASAGVVRRVRVRENLKRFLFII